MLFVRCNCMIVLKSQGTSEKSSKRGKRVYLTSKDEGYVTFTIVEWLKVGGVTGIATLQASPLSPQNNKVI